MGEDLCLYDHPSQGAILSIHSINSTLYLYLFLLPSLLAAETKTDLLVEVLLCSAF